MRVQRVSLIILIGAGLVFFTWQAVIKSTLPPRSSGETAPTSEDVSATSEDVSTTSTLNERRLGPFSVGGRSYFVVLHERPSRAESDEEAGNVVALMEIRDSNGEAQYSRSFSPAEDAWSISAQPFSGATGSGLLITYAQESEPSAPTPEEVVWWQLFGVIDGKLTPFSGPISLQGALLTKSKSDVLEFKVWAHHFRLIFPITVDWSTGKLSPTAQCVDCEYTVHPEDMNARADLTFVQLCSKAQTECSAPERILVRKDSVIELMAARGNVHWSEGSTVPPANGSRDSMSDQGELSVSEDVWLKVRLNGKEGWLHEREDFLALALPFEQ